jgi:hypothetical protein
MTDAPHRIPVDDVSNAARSLRGALLVLFREPPPGMRWVLNEPSEWYGLYLASLLRWVGLFEDLRIEVAGVDARCCVVLRVVALTEKGAMVRTALRFANNECVQIDA